MSKKPDCGERVRRQRTARGWSQAELARRAGISRAAVSAVEINRLVPSVAAALQLAHSLDCTVEDLFGADRPVDCTDWAWAPPHLECRFWQAEVGGRLLLYPVEETAAGEVGHDGVGTSSANRLLTPHLAARTLVVACCDPAAGLLAAEYGRQSGIRMIVLGRSSGAALELLERNVVHVAGVHLEAAGKRRGNAVVVEGRLGRPAGLLRLARWEEGVALASEQASRSLHSALRGRLRWVGREQGSGARQCLDDLLQRKRPLLLADNHRGVATAVRCGWADAGVCVRLVSEEAGLRFLPVRKEEYDLVFLKSNASDPRIEALLRVVRSPEYRRLLGELPGYDVGATGSLEWTGGNSPRRKRETQP